MTDTNTKALEAARACMDAIERDGAVHLSSLAQAIGDVMRRGGDIQECSDFDDAGLLSDEIVHYQLNLLGNRYKWPEVRLPIGRFAMRGPLEIPESIKRVLPLVSLDTVLVWPKNYEGPHIRKKRGQEVTFHGGILFEIGGRLPVTELIDGV